MNERPPFRGKRGAERRLAERITTEYAERKAKVEAAEVDFDVAEVDAEVDDVRRLEEAARARAAATAAAATAARSAPTASGAAAARPARRVPDLSVLPPLLVASGSFESLRQRIGRADAPVPPAGRHAGLTMIPHGAKSFLGAALAATGERLLWIARDSEIGDRLAEELGAWLGDPATVAVLEPRTALAYERSELVADETAARVAALAAWRSGAARVLVASRPGAPPAHDRAGRPARAAAAPQAGRPARARPIPDRAARTRLPTRDRGRRPGRIRPAGRDRRCLPARLQPARPDRALRGRDRFAPKLRSNRPADDRSSCCDRPPPGDRVPRPRGWDRGYPGRAGPGGRPPARTPGHRPRPLRAGARASRAAADRAAARPTAGPPDGRSMSVTRLRSGPGSSVPRRASTTSPRRP